MSRNVLDNGKIKLKEKYRKQTKINILQKADKSSL